VFNVGFSYEPADGALAGLSLQADYWSFAYDDAIRKESNVSVIEAFVAGDPAAQQKITLDGLGNIAVIRSEFINTATVDTAGIDFGARYRLDTEPAGSFDVFYNMTYLTEYEFQETAGGPTIDGRGKRNFQTIGAPAPKWRANAGLDWFLGNHSANLTVHYTDSYEQTTPQALIALFNGREPSPHIDDHVTVDVQYTYTFAELFGAGETTLTIGAINLLNEDPPTLDDGPGYDSKIHDPRGQILYGRVKVTL
jgi:iron complex outermembrane receptor protein